MTTMDDLFREYLHRIEPSPQAVSRAAEAHKPLRADLEKDEPFGPFVTSTILSGSYGRGTAIFGIKDVDVIIETTYASSDLLEHMRDGESEQACFLRLAQEAIKRTGRAASTMKARRSIHVTLPEDPESDLPEMTMDIVPVRIQTSTGNDPLTISDRELGLWLNTYPYTQLSDSIKRNKASNLIGDRHCYKPLVKIFKGWKKANYVRQKTPNGFVLECLTGHFHDPQAKTWLEAVSNLFENICTKWPDPDNLPLSPDIPEVSDISNMSPGLIPIAKNRDQAVKVLKKFHLHKQIITQAKEELEDDLDKSARTLRRIFGDEFPIPDDLEENNRTAKSLSIVREAPPFA